MKKRLQSLKISFPLIFTSILLTACNTTSGSKVAYEECSYADSIKTGEDLKFHEAFTKCVEKAKSGDPIAQKNLAYLYRFGTPNMLKDEDESRKWFKLAADQGNKSAIYRMGIIGEGTQIGMLKY